MSQGNPLCPVIRLTLLGLAVGFVVGLRVGADEDVVAPDAKATELCW